MANALGRRLLGNPREGAVRAANARIAGAMARKIPPKTPEQLEETYLRGRSRLTTAQARRVRKARRKQGIPEP